ncbi:MAG: ribosome-associated translation inhibitor RaiA [Clostridia bacterium]|nr:ribosome-associated translation inhibitor RaiA [Clostridia bacterium]MBQ3092493.1 ribosome-associated translation inhibitor RaiA [Clostridia bacterium]
MNVKFNERKAKIYNDRKEYIVKKCEKLDKYFGEDADAQVAYSFHGSEHTIELTVNYRSFFFRAEEKADDMLKAVDGVVDSIERQIRKNKTRLSKKMRQDSFAKTMSMALVDLPDPEVTEEDEIGVVRVKELDVKPMTVEDAIMQMELLNHEFFFFINSEDNKNKHAVVYKRKNGGYGLLVSKE